MRILELEEENRQLRYEVQELTGVTGFSVFTADMNGSITQTSRSHRARHWRGQLHAEVHALPAGRSTVRDPSRNRWYCGERGSVIFSAYFLSRPMQHAWDGFIANCLPLS